MFINVPKKIVVKNRGIIQKASGFSYILSDISNRDKNKVLKLNGQGFYSYVYDVSNTYLFIIGNQIGNKDVNPNKINFQEKVLNFEYTAEKKPKKIQTLDIPSNGFVLTAKEKWLQPDILGDNTKTVESIIQRRKTHLQSYKQPYERHLRYMCDSGLGMFKYGLVKDTLTENSIKVLKDTSFDGYIIKYDNTPFEC